MKEDNKIENKTSEELLPNKLWDHNYSEKNKISFNLDQQFADDISYADSNAERADREVEKVGNKLTNRNLNINKTKTEKYKIDGTKEDWKKCKYLGSYLDTRTDFVKRKQLSNAAYSSYRSTLESKKIKMKTRIRLFKAYIESIFLYNSEVWTMNKKLEHDIDVFQRNLLRRILKIHYPNKISNEDLYSRTGVEPWSQDIKKRRLRWTGHMMRLDETTPVRQALNEATRKAGKKKRGNHKTWIKVINEDLSNIDPEMSIDSQKLVKEASDRNGWNRKITQAFCTRPTLGETVP